MLGALLALVVQLHGLMALANLQLVQDGVKAGAALRVVGLIRVIVTTVAVVGVLVGVFNRQTKAAPDGINAGAALRLVGPICVIVMIVTTVVVVGALVGVLALGHTPFGLAICRAPDMHAAVRYVLNCPITEPKSRHGHES